jgi:hypothetical protein
MTVWAVEPDQSRSQDRLDSLYIASQSRAAERGFALQLYDLDTRIHDQHMECLRQFLDEEEVSHA